MKCKTKELYPGVPRFTKSELQEILQAKMAGGDLYAMEEYLKWKHIDIILDRLRVMPIYSDSHFSSPKSSV